MSFAPPVPQPTDPADDVAASARGWNGIQMGVLAFIGLCGVLSDTDTGDPDWLVVTAGVLAVVALGVACLATFLVASVGWTLTGRAVAAPSASRRLRYGVGLTYVAVALMALAASGSWWPSG